MKIFTSAFICLALSYGCTATDSPGDHINRDFDRIYSYSYLNVYDAVLAAARKKNLGVNENANTSGNSLGLNQGITLSGWGDKFTVFVKMNTDNSTEVYIPKKPLTSTLYFPHEWQKMMLDQIDYELRANNSGKAVAPSSGPGVLPPSVQ